MYAPSQMRKGRGSLKERTLRSFSSTPVLVHPRKMQEVQKVTVELWVFADYMRRTLISGPDSVWELQARLSDQVESLKKMSWENV